MSIYSTNSCAQPIGVDTSIETTHLSPSRDGRKSREPQRPDSFGYVLWLIIGGENARIGEAADLLGIDRPSLSKIIHNKQHISQFTMKSQRWPAVLAKHFPAGWMRHKSNFYKHAAKLKRAQNKVKRPEDPESVGYVLWLILGGEDANLGEAAGRLKIQRPSLSAIIHGLDELSQDTLYNKHVREILAEHYPDSWNIYKDKFEVCVRNQARKNRANKAGGSANYWKRAAAVFITRVMTERGDEFGDIIPSATVPSLQTEKTWQKVGEGDSATCLSIYRAALREICKAYGIDDSRGGALYSHVHYLIIQLT
jgi:plasmid maintenance system antidote protein VapI